MSAESARIRRYNNKWAMCGYKKGKCARCGEIVTYDNIAEFEFDHKDQLNNGDDKSDRWGGAIRGWKPFTEKWYAWADKVDLLCARCHRRRHGCELPLLDWGAQRRSDAYQHGDELTTQLGMF